MAFDKKNQFVVVEDGVVKVLTAAEYSSSYGFVPTSPHDESSLDGASDGHLFAGSYSKRVFPKSGSHAGNPATQFWNEGIWDSSTFVSESEGQI